MIQNPTDFVSLFNQIGTFLVRFNQLLKMKPKMSPDEFYKGFDDFFKGHNPSDGEEALEAYDNIVATIYRAGCSSGPTRMR